MSADTGTGRWRRVQEWGHRSEFWALLIMAWVVVAVIALGGHLAGGEYAEAATDITEGLFGLALFGGAAYATSGREFLTLVVVSGGLYAALVVAVA